MAKAKKLPSGQWNVTVYSHTEGGKRRYASFTAPSKAEAEMKAAEFALHKKRRNRCDMTVREAIEGYIQSKDGVLSPATIRGYDKMLRNNYASIEQKKIRQLSTEDVQLFVSGLAADHSAKTVGNIYGLLRASIAFYMPDIHFRVTLPAKKKERPVSASQEDVRALLDAATPQFKLRVALAACGLRRGELCALKYEDIKDGVAHVHATMAQDKNNKWIYKEIPKTAGSDRYVKLPPVVVEMIGEGSGRIVRCYPPAVTAGFIRLRNKVGVDKRLHDMRHFFASAAAILNIPKIYLADMGGWERDSHILEAVYQNNITSMSDFYSDRMADFLNDTIKEKSSPQTDSFEDYAKRNAKRLLADGSTTRVEPV